MSDSGIKPTTYRGMPLVTSEVNMPLLPTLKESNSKDQARVPVHKQNNFYQWLHILFENIFLPDGSPGEKRRKKQLLRL